MKNLFLMTFISLGLAACSFNESDTINKQETEDNLKLEKVYSDIRGEYQGKLFNANGTQDITIQIYTLSMKDGINSDGTNKLRLVPKAYVKRVNPVGESQLMDIRYIPESGQITFTVSADSKAGPDDIHTINGYISGQTLKGEVLRPTGPFGQVEVQLVSKQTTTPDGGSAKEEIAQNLLREYEKIIGEYSGVVQDSKVDNGLTYPIQVRLFITKEVINGAIMPVLRGFFKRPDDKNAVFDLALNVAYDPTVLPATITMSGKGDGKFFLAMDGYIQNNQMFVNFSTHRGLAGQVILNKTK